MARDFRVENEIYFIYLWKGQCAVLHSFVCRREIWEVTVHSCSTCAWNFIEVYSCSKDFISMLQDILLKVAADIPISGVSVAMDWTMRRDGKDHLAVGCGTQGSSTFPTSSTPQGAGTLSKGVKLMKYSKQDGAQGLETDLPRFPWFPRFPWATALPWHGLWEMVSLVWL